MGLKETISKIAIKLGLKANKPSSDNFEAIFGISKDFEQDILLLAYKKADNFHLDEHGYLVLEMENFKMKYRNKYSSNTIEEIRVSGKTILSSYEVKNKELIKKLNELVILTENSRSQLISQAITSILNKNS